MSNLPTYKSSINRA